MNIYILKLTNIHMHIFFRIGRIKRWFFYVNPEINQQMLT